MHRSIRATSAAKRMGIAKRKTGLDSNREFKNHRLTDKGKKQLVVEESQ